MAQSDFYRCLSEAKTRLTRASIELTRARELASQDDMPGAFGAAFVLSAEAEKLALLTRTLPAYTGHPKALELSEGLIADIVPITMGYTDLGWFCLRLPMLLPKKESGSPTYIQQALYPAMRRFFADKVPVCYRDCVLIYRHIYDRQRPERAWRDHDNIEQNMVTDIIALYLMPDDAPKYCSHFYCSASGPEDCTEVYLVPREQFPTWLYAAFHDKLEGVKLYEEQPK